MIIICPGQGAQHVGMGQAWIESSPEAKAVFDQADAVLDVDLSSACFNGPDVLLNRTDIAQAAIYTTSVACFKALKLDGITATAGLSLGEFTALHLAGAFSFEDGLKLVRLRGQAMQDAAEASDGGMIALIGADETQAVELCEKAMAACAAETTTADASVEVAVDSTGIDVTAAGGVGKIPGPGGVLVPANFNCPGQIVISGSKSCCDVAMKIADEMGLRATALVVAGAFHSPLMQPAADRLAEALEQTQWSVPNVTVLSNVTGEPHTSDINSIKQRLVAQLTSPVRWSESMSWAIANLEGEFHELAPGKVLSGLMRRIDRKTRVNNHAEPGE